MSSPICLNPTYSTTRLLTRVKPAIDSPPNSELQGMLFPPPNTNRRGEGGLRTNGYFKRSQPDKPLITVITIVFNGENHLEETIQSVIKQSYDNLEYIIIDGGSTDGTVDIIRRHEWQIDYWLSEPDAGIFDAMNKGLRLTSSCWLNFMNCGDMFINADSIDNCIKYLTDNDLILYSDTVFYKLMNKIPYYKLFSCDHNRLNIVHQSCLYNIKLHCDHGLFISHKSLTISDYIFFSLIPGIKWRKTAHKIALYLVDNNISVGFRHNLQKMCVDILMKNNSYYRCIASAIINSLRYALSILLPEEFYITKFAKFKNKLNT
jgi:glycosyltransferase involved in cell wall biosynthesis